MLKYFFMDNPLLPTPDKTVNDYLLILNPHEALRNKIEKTRNELLEKYRLNLPPAGKPNVSLVKFSASAQMEEKIINRLQLITMEEKPFVVELRDYGSYPMHAIFIRIANQPRVLQLIKKLKQSRTLMKVSGADPHFLLDPQIALAGRLQKEKYLEAIKEYDEKKFSGRFLADYCLLLTRRKNEKMYRVLKRFEFECVPGPVAQGILFR